MPVRLPRQTRYRSWMATRCAVHTALACVGTAPPNVAAFGYQPTQWPLLSEDADFFEQIAFFTSIRYQARLRTPRTNFQCNACFMVWNGIWQMHGDCCPLCAFLKAWALWEHAQEMLFFTETYCFLPVWIDPTFMCSWAWGHSGFPASYLVNGAPVLPQKSVSDHLKAIIINTIARGEDLGLATRVGDEAVVLSAAEFPEFSELAADLGLAELLASNPDAISGMVPCPTAGSSIAPAIPSETSRRCALLLKFAPEWVRWAADQFPQGGGRIVPVQTGYEFLLLTRNGKMIGACLQSMDSTIEWFPDRFGIPS